MKRFSLIAIPFLFASLFLNAQTVADKDSPTFVSLPAGTRALLALKNPVSTRTTSEGAGVYLEAIESVVVDGHVAIPQGTQFQGTVRMTKRPGKLKGRAALQLTVDRMIYSNAYVVDFSSVVKSSDGNQHQSAHGKEGTIEAESTIGRDVLLVGAGTLGGGLGGGAIGLILGGAADDPGAGGRIGAGAGAAIGLISTVLMRGQDVRLERGSTVEIAFQQPVQLDLSRIPAGLPANYVPPQRPLAPQRPERQSRGRPPILPFPRLPF